jgi:hypothetical protein
MPSPMPRHTAVAAARAICQRPQARFWARAPIPGMSGISIELGLAQARFAGTAPVGIRGRRRAGGRLGPGLRPAA